MILGIIIGAVVMLLFCKFSMARTGCGELKMCKTHCPYYTSVELNSRSNDVHNEVDEDD